MSGMETELLGLQSVKDVLAHYGVKGMKWGVTTKDRAPSVTKIQDAPGKKSANDVTVRQRKPGTYAKAKGGQRQEASEDAIKALAARQKAKKSTTDALSNAELRAAVERMNLEQQYANLAYQSDRRSRGARFVAGFLGSKRYGGKEKRRFKDASEEVGEMSRGTMAGVANVVKAAAQKAASA